MGLVRRLRQLTASKVVSNGMWFMADRLFRMAVGLVVGAMVARHLGPSGFGQVSLAVAFAALFTSIANGGLDSLAVKALVERPADEALTLHALFLIRVVAGLGAWLLAAATGLVLWHDEQQLAALAMLYGASLLLSAADPFEQWLIAKQFAKPAVLARTLAFCITALCRAALTFTAAGPAWFVGAMLFELLLAAVLLWRASRAAGRPKLEVRRAPAAVIPKCRQLLAQSWPLVLSGLSVAAFTKIDQVILSKFVPVAELGHYAAAMRLVELWSFVPPAVIAAAGPAITRARGQDMATYTWHFVRLFRVLVGAGLLLAALQWCLARMLILLLFGQDFLPAVPLLRCLTWVLPLMFCGSLVTLWLMNEGMTTKILGRAAAGAAISLVLLLALVPAFGVVAASWTLLLVQFLMGIALPLMLPAAHGLRQILRQALFLPAKVE